MQEILSWGLIVAFVAIGLGVLQVPNPKRAIAAKMFFSLAAIILGVKIFMWANSPSHGLMFRIVACALGFAALGIMLTLAFWFAGQTQDSNPADATPPAQQPSAPEEPNFTVFLGQAITFYERRRDITVLLIEVEIRNSGAPSAALHWKAHYKSSTLDSDILIIKPVTEPLKIPLPSKPRLPNEAEVSLDFYRADSIDEKTALNAITRGVPVRGRLPLLIPGEREDEIGSSDAVITVTTYDYLQRPYQAQYIGGRTEGGERLVRLPGEKFSPVKKKRTKK
jgi:hypothetical protein